MGAIGVAMTTRCRPLRSGLPPFHGQVITLSVAHFVTRASTSPRCGRYSAGRRSKWTGAWSHWPAARCRESRPPQELTVKVLRYRKVGLRQDRAARKGSLGSPLGRGDGGFCSVTVFCTRRWRMKTSVAQVRPHLLRVSGVIGEDAVVVAVRHQFLAPIPARQAAITTCCREGANHSPVTASGMVCEVHSQVEAAPGDPAKVSAAGAYRAAPNGCRCLRPRCQNGMA
jgi:hypothetical protein